MASTTGRSRALDELPADLELATRPKAPAGDPSRWRVCGVCGQDYDMRDLMQADHHGPGPHAPFKS